MKKSLYFLFTSIFIIIGCNSGHNPNHTSLVNSTESTQNTENVKVVYNVLQSSDLYSEPNEAATKLINQKATKALGEVHYLSIDKTCKVVVLDSNNNWSKIQVVEPDWLNESHIGWVETKILQHPDDVEKDLTTYEENKDYQVLYSKYVGTTNNLYILLLWKDFDEDRLEKLANYIKREKSPQENCNINIYDSKDIVHLIEKYPIKGQEYVDVADHYVYMLTFDGMGWYYPLKDALYIEYGGKKPKQ
jgi:hypothetical protein